MALTLKDIAERTGLSSATVSRALGAVPSPYVSEDTRQRVRAVAAELGYRPNLNARNLATRRSNILALLTDDWFGAYHGLYGQAIPALAAARGYTAVPESVEAAKVAGQGSPLLHWPVAGVIAIDVRAEALRELEAENLPVVQVAAVCRPTGADQVQLDLQAATEQAIRHLLTRGPRVAYLVAPEFAGFGDRRAVAYEQVMRAAGLVPVTIPLHVTERGSFRRAAQDSVRAWVARHGSPDGIFCNNDEMAVGCCRGLRDLGLRVPDDVAVVGCDGLEEAEFHNPALTTIVHPFAEVCTAALDFITARIAQPDLPQQVAVFPSALVIRESSGG
jgi:DNA-binding LacI/PurR family transcriptional regulator